MRSRKRKWRDRREPIPDFALPTENWPHPSEKPAPQDGAFSIPKSVSQGATPHSQAPNESE